MRVYLDTNILAFIVGQDRGSSISDDVKGIIKDYESLLLSSCVCYGELMHLIQIGKVHVPAARTYGVRPMKPSGGWTKSGSAWCL